MAEGGDFHTSFMSAFTAVPSVPQHIMDILDELCCKFMVNIVQENRGDLKCLFFQAEQAYWHYTDYYHEKNPLLYPQYTMKEFCQLLFKQYPELLENHEVGIGEAYQEWRRFKSSVPTYGAIIIDDTLKFILLVQAYTAKVSWGFPKGKIQAGESPEHCACREVMEETSLDITPLLGSDIYLEKEVNERLTRLYIITGINKDTKFHPNTRNEIKDYGWFKTDDLPASSKDVTGAQKLGLKPAAFATVIPFLKPLKKWLKTKIKNLSEGKSVSSESSYNTSSVFTGTLQSGLISSTDDYCDEIRAIFGVKPEAVAKQDQESHQQTQSSKVVSGADAGATSILGAGESSAGVCVGEAEELLNILGKRLDRLTEAFANRYQNLLKREQQERHERKQKQLESIKNVIQFDMKASLLPDK